MAALLLGAECITFASEPPTIATAHFRIRHNTPPAEVDSIAACLERTHDAVLKWCQSADIPAHPSTQPLEIVLHDRFEDFSVELVRLAPDTQGAVGLYVQDSNTTILCRLDRLPMIDAIDRELEDRPADAATANLRARRDALVARIRQLVVAHETAHQVLFNVGVLDRRRRYPFWLVEGLACLFESACANPPGPTPSPRVFDLPAKSLTETTLRTIVSGGPFEDPVTQSEPARYALAYLLVDYLHNHHRPALIRFLRESTATELSPLEAFTTRFAPIDARLIDALKRHLRSLQIPEPPSTP